MLIPRSYLCFLLLNIVIYAGNVGETQDENLLSFLLNALLRLVQFYEENGDNMNIDGLFGARVAEGRLAGILSQMKALIGTRKVLRQELLQIQNLQERFEKVVTKSLRAVKEYQPLYFNKIGFMLTKGLWRKIYPLRTLGSLESPFVAPYTPFNEAQSDSCFHELMEKQCQISDKCWQPMTVYGGNNYNITHKVFYLMTTYELGCEIEAEERAQSSHRRTVSDIEKTLCSSILMEARDIAREKFPLDDRDIFLEQILFCGMLGYKEFLNLNWLRNILKWQKDDGCYGFYEFSDFSRRKRADRVISANCGSHASSVAAAALSEFVRSLVDPIFLTN